MKTVRALFFMTSLTAFSATTNNVGHIVLLDPVTGVTRPENSIATPAQVTTAEEAADAAKETALALQSTADLANSVAQAASQRAYLYSSNYVVTSTVYVQSIGGVPFDPSNQVLIARSVTVTATNVVVLATCRQTPLATPVLDWRQSLSGGSWSNTTATVESVDIPAGITNAAAAYTFTVARPEGGSAFFRVVDNSTGASGSGLYWLVFGGIFVDGHRGMYGAITNVVGTVTNTYSLKGGIVVEPDPL